MIKTNKISGVYAITDENLISESAFIPTIKNAISGGIQTLQYRAKRLNLKTQIKQCQLLKALCQQYNVTFIINDNINIALDVDANGVHLGKTDSSISAARKILGDTKIIGVSSYNNIEMALAAQKQGANYIAFGRFFPSTTKPHAPVANISTLSQAKDTLKIPIVAIGGINHTNGQLLIENGADSIAVINSIFGQTDTYLAAKRLSHLFK